MLTYAADTALPPTVRIDQRLMPSTATGLLFMIDLDVPRNGTRVANLHWLVPGVTNVNGVLNIPIPNANSTPRVSYLNNVISEVAMVAGNPS